MDCRAYLVVVSNRFWETMYLDYSASLGPKKSDRLDPPTLSANSVCLEMALAASTGSYPRNNDVAVISDEALGVFSVS